AGAGPTVPRRARDGGGGPALVGRPERARRRTELHGPGEPGRGRPAPVALLAARLARQADVADRRAARAGVPQAAGGAVPGSGGIAAKPGGGAGRAGAAEARGALRGEPRRGVNPLGASRPAAPEAHRRARITQDRKSVA